MARILEINHFKNETKTYRNLWDLVETGIISDGGEGDNSLVLVSGLLDDASNLSDGEWLTVTAGHAESLQDDGVELLSGTSSEESVELKIEQKLFFERKIDNLPWRGDGDKGSHSLGPFCGQRDRACG